MRVYELMSRLENLPSGAKVMCSGVYTIDKLTNSMPFDEDDYGNKEYLIAEEIIEFDIEGDYVYLQF